MTALTAKQSTRTGSLFLLPCFLLFQHDRCALEEAAVCSDRMAGLGNKVKSAVCPEDTRGSTNQPTKAIGSLRYHRKL